MVYGVPFVFFLFLSDLLQGRQIFTLSCHISQWVRWFWQRTHDWAMGSWWVVDGLHHFLNWLASRTWNHVHTICNSGYLQTEFGLNSYLSAAGFLTWFQQRVQPGQSSVLHILDWVSWCCCQRLHNELHNICQKREPAE